MAFRVPRFFTLLGFKLFRVKISPDLFDVKSYFVEIAASLNL
jgi:hypothetical protein